MCFSLNALIDKYEALVAAGYYFFIPTLQMLYHNAVLFGCAIT